MGKRREPRVPLDIQVKVCGMDTAGHPFVQSAYAIQISRSGVRLTGVGPLVRVGEIVVVIYKNRKARFKVVWIGAPGQPEAGQAGLEAADPNALIWDFALPHPGIDGYSTSASIGGYSGAAVKTDQSTQAPAFSTSATPILRSAPETERRNAARYKCRGSADMYVTGVSFPTRGQIDDISLSGVYIQTAAPLLVNNIVNLHLTIQGFSLQAEAEVRTSHPGVGMGLIFTKMTTENRLVLGAVVNRLAGVAASAGKPKTAPPAEPLGPKSEPLGPRSQQQSPAMKWDAIGRSVSEWFQNHENLTKDEFLDLIRRQ